MYFKFFYEFFSLVAGVADFGTKVIFPRIALLPLDKSESNSATAITRTLSPGDYVSVTVTAASTETLKGMATALTSLQPYGDSAQPSTATQ